MFPTYEVVCPCGEETYWPSSRLYKIQEIVRQNEAADVSFIAKSIMDYALTLDADKASDDMSGTGYGDHRWVSSS